MRVDIAETALEEGRSGSGGSGKSRSIRRVGSFFSGGGAEDVGEGEHQGDDDGLVLGLQFEIRLL